MIKKTIDVPAHLWTEIEAELGNLGGINFSDFARMSFKNQIRRERAARLREEGAPYGRDEVSPPVPSRRTGTG